MENPIPKEAETLEGLNLRQNRIRESKPSNGNQGKPVASVDVSTLAHAKAHAKALRAHVLNVVIWVTKPLISQASHGIVGVILRDPERESSQWYNKIT